MNLTVMHASQPPRPPLALLSLLRSVTLKSRETDKFDLALLQYKAALFSSFTSASASAAAAAASSSSCLPLSLGHNRGQYGVLEVYFCLLAEVGWLRPRDRLSYTRCGIIAPIGHRREMFTRRLRSIGRRQ